jgi:hypothetical protein
MSQSMKELITPIKNQKMYPIALREPSFVSVALKGELKSTKKFMEDVSLQLSKQKGVKLTPLTQK